MCVASLVVSMRATMCSRSRRDRLPSFTLSSSDPVASAPRLPPPWWPPSPLPCLPACALSSSSAREGRQRQAKGDGVVGGHREPTEPEQSVCAPSSSEAEIKHKGTTDPSTPHAKGWVNREKEGLYAIRAALHIEIANRAAKGVTLVEEDDDDDESFTPSLSRRSLWPGVRRGVRT